MDFTLSNPPPHPPHNEGTLGTFAFGGVSIEAGAGEIVLVLLPVNDAHAFSSLPAFADGAVRAIIVCNTRDHGVLRTSAVARAAGLSRVYALDPSRPVDTGGGTTVAVKPLPRRLRLHALDVFVREGNVVAQIPKDDAPLALIGDGVPLSLVFRVGPRTVIGMIGMDDDGHKHEPDVRIDGAVLMANVPGLDAMDAAKFLAAIGIATTIVNTATSRRERLFAHLLRGEHDAAAALAHEAIAHEDETEHMRAQLDVVAAMRASSQRFPEHAQLAFDVLKPLLDERRFEDVLPLLARAVAWDPDNTALAVEHGHALSQLGRDHDAIAFYDSAIARGGFNALLRFNRALCLLRLQRHAEAADDLRAVLTLKPDWHDAHELLRTLG